MEQPGQYLTVGLKPPGDILAAEGSSVESYVELIRLTVLKLARREVLASAAHPTGLLTSAFSEAGVSTRSGGVGSKSRC